MKKCHKSVVVIGGGFTGAYVAKKLEGHFDVTLIDTKDYFEFTPGVLRTIVNPQHARKIQVLHEQYLRRAKFIRGHVYRADHAHVFVGREKIPYDYLVIASGWRYGLPFKQHNLVAAQRGRTLRNSHTEVEKAVRILIIGGGTVGVELAGELITKYPKKDVVLVHSREALMQRACEPAKHRAEKWLRKKGVEVILGERVQETQGTVFKTNKGREIHADLAFICTGIIPNAEFLKKNFPDTVDKKSLLVDKYLRLQGSKNIFVGGDITNIPEEKLAQNAEKHAQVIVENIRCDHMNKKLCVYKSQPRPILVSLGKWHAIFTYKNICVHGLMPALLKWFVEWRTMKRYKKGA